MILGLFPSFQSKMKRAGRKKKDAGLLKRFRDVQEQPLEGADPAVVGTRGGGRATSLNRDEQVGSVGDEHSVRQQHALVRRSVKTSALSPRGLSPRGSVLFDIVADVPRSRGAFR